MESVKVYGATTIVAVTTVHSRMLLVLHSSVMRLHSCLCENDSIFLIA